jgi:hypothetical protein
MRFSKNTSMTLLIVLVVINLIVIGKVIYDCNYPKEQFNEQNTSNKLEQAALLSTLLATDKDIDVDNTMNFRKGAGIHNPDGLGFIPEGQSDAKGRITMVGNQLNIRGNPNTRVQGSLRVTGNTLHVGDRNALQRRGNTLSVGRGYRNVSIEKPMTVSGNIVGRKVCVGNNNNRCMDDGLLTKLEQLPNMEEIDATMKASKETLEKSLEGKLNIMNTMIHDDGTLNVSGRAHFKGGTSRYNPGGWDTHFRWREDNHNYIRGDTEMRGNLDMQGPIRTPHNISHPDNADGIIYRGDGQLQVAVDDYIRFRNIRSRDTGIQFDTRRGTGDMHHPNGQMKITRQGIMFGGPNDSSKELNSAQISAGRHRANSLNIVGMSSNRSSGTRKIDVWAEGGMDVRGPVTIHRSGDGLILRGNNPRLCINNTCVNESQLKKIL